jgi:dTDP-N-acetylfucosamine:lipid II N-acetylfucosaminyltransferase
MDKPTKILHLSHDNKCIDVAIRTFEDILPGANDLYLYADKNIFYTKTTPIKTLTAFTKFSRKDLALLEEYDVIFVHSLNFHLKRFIKQLPKNIPIVWFGWGYDYYNIIHQNSDTLILPRTLSHYSAVKNNNTFKRYMSKIKDKVKNILWEQDELKIIERIDYFIPVLPNEYQLIKNKYEGLNFPSFIEWSYGTLEHDFTLTEEAKCVGNNILIGNSSAIENNHLEVFDLIKAIDVSNRQLILPLSYGEGDAWRNLIIEYGRNAFSNSFLPITKFMEIKQYIKLLQSCGFVIMNHIRQQAVGNIIIMMYLGAKIFLRKECPTYDFFIERGAIIYSVQDLEEDLTLIEKGLSDIDKEINRNVIRDYWSTSKVKKKTVNLIDIVLKQSL